MSSGAVEPDRPQHHAQGTIRPSYFFGQPRLWTPFLAFVARKELTRGRSRCWSVSRHWSRSLGEAVVSALQELELCQHSTSSGYAVFALESAKCG